MSTDVITACPECGTDMMTCEEYGRHRNQVLTWEKIVCQECGYSESLEPDWDSMTGGRDDY